MNDAVFSIGVLALVFYLLAFTRIPADMSLISGVLLLLLKGVIEPRDALAGLANEAVATVGILFVVSAGVRDSGGITLIAERLLGRPKTERRAILRLMVPAAVASAFMNNTPLVAMLIPAVNDWAKKCQFAVSRLMIPLSYAAILGGTCTLIGTSTNIVVSGLVVRTAQAEIRETGSSTLPEQGLGMFTITWIGLPAAVTGIAVLALAGRWLLPDRRPPISEHDDPRSYTVEMLVPPDSPLVGKTIEQAGLRHLSGVYLAEIDRTDEILPAVSSQERLHGGDRLVFVGVVDSVVDLRKIRGLVPATDQVFKLTTGASGNRCLIEAVVSSSCPLVGKSIREGRFRSVYDAAVIAVARDGQRVMKKIGDIVLQPGDTLLLESDPSFAERQRNSRDFFLVSKLENSSPPRHEKAIWAMLILGMLVVLLATGWLHIVAAALLAATLMLLFRCTSVSEARRSIDWEVLLAIAASFAIGAALDKSGAARWISESLVALAAGNPHATLAVVAAVTLMMTELITNNAAAALMFPLAISTANQLGVSPMPFVIALMMGSSASFATPIGYQTNLMVYGPGGYRFTDYLRIGIPMNLLVWTITMILTPWFFPFHR